MTIFRLCGNENHAVLEMAPEHYKGRVADDTLLVAIAVGFTRKQASNMNNVYISLGTCHWPDASIAPTGVQSW